MLQDMKDVQAILDSSDRHQQEIVDAKKESARRMLQVAFNKIDDLGLNPSDFLPSGPTQNTLDPTSEKQGSRQCLKCRAWTFNERCEVCEREELELEMRARGRELEEVGKNYATMKEYLDDVRYNIAQVPWEIYRTPEGWRAGDLCCKRAAGKYCYEHDSNHWIREGGQWYLVDTDGVPLGTLEELVRETSGSVNHIYMENGIDICPLCNEALIKGDVVVIDKDGKWCHSNCSQAGETQNQNESHNPQENSDLGTGGYHMPEVLGPEADKQIIDLINSGRGDKGKVKTIRKTPGGGSEIEFKDGTVKKLKEIRVRKPQGSPQEISEITEKERRVYYQSIVYDVCNQLDILDGRPISKGLICGTVEEPSEEVQRKLKQLINEYLILKQREKERGGSDFFPEKNRESAGPKIGNQGLYYYMLPGGASQIDCLPARSLGLTGFTQFD